MMDETERIHAFVTVFFFLVCELCHYYWLWLTDPETIAKHEALASLQEASVGLTASVDTKVLLQWIELCRQDEEKLRILISAVSFRCQFLCDSRAIHSLSNFLGERQALDVYQLVIWAMPPPFKGYAHQCVEALASLELRRIPQNVALILFEEVIRRRNNTIINDVRRYSQRIHGYLTLMKIIGIEESVWNTLSTSCYTKTSDCIAPAYWHRTFLQRLTELLHRQSAESAFLSAHLPRLCTRFRYYSRATQLLQFSLTARFRLNNVGVLQGVKSWMDDCRSLVDSMEQGLVDVDAGFSRSSYQCLATTLRSFDSSRVDPVELGEAFLLVGNALMEQNACSAALDCLDGARDVLATPLESNILQVSKALRYLGIVLWSRGMEESAWACFDGHSKLNECPSPTHLLQVIKTLGPDHVEVTLDDPGLEFSIGLLRKRMDSACRLCELFVQSLVQVDEESEAQLDVMKNLFAVTQICRQLLPPAESGSPTS